MLKAPEKCYTAEAKDEISITDPNHSHRAGRPFPTATASTTLLKNDQGDWTGLLYSWPTLSATSGILRVRPSLPVTTMVLDFGDHVAA